MSSVPRRQHAVSAQGRPDADVVPLPSAAVVEGVCDARGTGMRRCGRAELPVITAAFSAIVLLRDRSPYES